MNYELRITNLIKGVSSYSTCIQNYRGQLRGSFLYSRGDALACVLAGVCFFHKQRNFESRILLFLINAHILIDAKIHAINCVKQFNVYIQQATQNPGSESSHKNS
jgi:hypothetical protein